MDKIQKKQKVSKEAVAGLKKKNLVEGRYPNVFISSAIAEISADKARYIKNRGFDDAHYERLILEYIEKYKEASRKDVEQLILDKLSDVLNGKQKQNKINNLLSKMRRKGLIKNIGILTKPRWSKLS